VTVDPTHLHTEPVGQVLHGFGEPEPVDLHQEADDVSALLAPEAVEEAARRSDVERGGLLVVEGAQTLEGPTPGLAQRHVGGDHVVDARLLAHLCDVVLTDAASHVAESTAPGTR